MSRARAGGGPIQGSISGRARPSKAGALGCGLFAALFLLIGGGMSAFFVVPALHVLEARSWPEVPCTILSSRVEEHSDSDGSTYSVDVRYAYQVDGREYRSDRYQFLGGSSSGYDGKAEVVARLPAGTRTVCYVNPEDPADAVLHRGFTVEYLIGLVPLFFFMIGLAGLWLAVQQARARPAPSAAGAGTLRAAPRLASVAGSGPRVLRPRAGPVGKFVGMTLLALFWNGIVGVFVFQAVEGWRAGQPDGCLTLFLVPFVLVGLGLIAGVPYSFLGLFNPRLDLTLSSGAVPPGGVAWLEWRFSGAAGRIRRLRITLEGREEATYRRGTDTYTDRETFATVEVVDTASPLSIPAGRAGFNVPEPTMHSFSAPHNKIVWTLKAHGEIQKWPDVSEEYELIVCPKGAVPGWTP